MKKIVSILMALSLFFCLVGCDVLDDAPKKETGNVSQSENDDKAEQKDTTFALTETAVFDNMKITAEELKESDGDILFKPETGKTFVGIKFTVENISKEEMTVSSLLLFEGYVDDVKNSMSITASTVFGETLDGTIAVGKKLVGWYAMEVPNDWENIELDVKSDWLSNTSAKFVFENK